MANNNRLIRLQIKVRPKGLHSFTFSTLNFKFSSTTVESALQIHLFMQNKANFRKSQMNVTSLRKADYAKKDTWSSGKNKPKTKPIQSQSNPIKANKMPKQTQFKAKQSQFPFILVSLIWLCIISFSVIVTLQIFMEIL